MHFIVTENIKIGAETWLMKLSGDTSSITAPGQFVNIAVEGCFLRRPLSICDWKEGEITLAYDVIGAGTKKLSDAVPGDKFDLLNALGNGFDATVDTRKPLLLGGGIGVAPLVGTARELLNKGIIPVAVLGYNSADRIILTDLFENLGVETIITTVDGSAGIKGFVTDAIAARKIDYDYFYACGPMPMLRALCLMLERAGELSLDVRMACGFGACMCCSLETAKGPVCVCKQGPVFKKEDLIWNN